MLLLLIITGLFLHSVFSCAPNEFQCGDKTCVTQNFRCDNFKDCKDGSDEIGCVTKGCQPFEFRCGDGMCITNEFRCDNFKDCKDGSDEIGCNAKQEPKCTEGCKEPTLLYEDLQCKPKLISLENCCPSAFDCAHIEARANLVEEKCHFRGKTYNVNETVSYGEVYGTCSSNCVCRRLSNGRLSFDCKEMKCAEWFSHGSNTGCRPKYELGKCCSSGKICGPLYPSCKIGEKIYYEDQRFDSPTEKCTYCICKRNQGYQQPYICSKYQCVQELRYHHEVMHFCAPSYLTMNDCCPISWICPRNDQIITSKNNHKSKQKCRFGNILLNVGDKFKRLHKPSGGKVVCECRIPPYLTCVQDYMYPTGAN